MTEPIPTDFETGDPGDEQPEEIPEPIRLIITDQGVFPEKTYDV